MRIVGLAGFFSGITSATVNKAEVGVVDSIGLAFDQVYRFLSIIKAGPDIHVHAKRRIPFSGKPAWINGDGGCL